jgi:hypothetical protein
VLLRVVRVWLPVAVVDFGVAVMAIGHDLNAAEGGAGIIGAGIAIWMLNVMTRIGFQGDRERDVEADARGFYDRWGHWPDEPGPGHAPGAEDEPPPRPSDPHHRAEGGPGRRIPPRQRRRG